MMDKVKEEAEQYSEYLRKELGDKLTSAVAEVIEKRPSDPIYHLSEYLYKSRNMKIPTSQMLKSRRHQIQRWTTETAGDGNNHSETYVTQQNCTRQLGSHNNGTVGMVASSDDGFVDEGFDQGDSTRKLAFSDGRKDNNGYTTHSEKYEIVQINAKDSKDISAKVHSFVKELFLEIGDLFNDEDIL